MFQIKIIHYGYHKTLLPILKNSSYNPIIFFNSIFITWVCKVRKFKTSDIRHIPLYRVDYFRGKLQLNGHKSEFILTCNKSVPFFISYDQDEFIQFQLTNNRWLKLNNVLSRVNAFKTQRRLRHASIRTKREERSK